MHAIEIKYLINISLIIATKITYGNTYMRKKINKMDRLIVNYHKNFYHFKKFIVVCLQMFFVNLPDTDLYKNHSKLEVTVHKI